MRKLYFLFFIALLLFSASSRAQEKLLYSSTFQDWTSAGAASTESTVAQKTSFSLEDFTVKLKQITVSPTGTDSKFNTEHATPGYLRAEKVADSYIEFTSLKSVTKVEFVHAATGSSRGFKFWKKSSTDADWVEMSSDFADPAGGDLVSVTINGADVALKFTNLTTSQYAFLLSIKIYGNYTSSLPQYPLVTSLNIENAGSLTRTPNSDSYDEGTEVSLQATPNFGYKFVKWVDGSTSADLGTANPYSVNISEAKNIQAVFQSVNTYSLTVTKAGSQWGEVQLTPAPTNGKYEEGTEVQMRIVPNPVTNFSYWEDNSTTLERVITVDGDKSFTATFDEIPFIVGWDFRATDPKANRQGDFYSESTNTGLISIYEPNGAVVNWLANSNSFSPAYPNIRLWTSGAEFATKRRYLKAQFSTENYKNIQVKSLVTANFQAYSGINMLYSLDDITYTPLASVNISTAYPNGTWENLNAVLPADAEGKARVYIKWIADEASALLGDPSTNDGTAYTNVFVFGDKEVVADTEAPVLVSNVPVQGSNTASITGAVVLTFNEKVKAGSGDITLGSKVVTGVFGSKTASFPYEKLSYGATYTLTVPAGALTDASGNPFAGVTITFTTGSRTEPAKKLFDAVVATDGSGDHLSVIDAIAAAPAGRTSPWLIYVKNGTYTGHHNITSTKPFIHLIGQSRDGVIISDNRLCGDDQDPATPTYSVQEGATMVVNATDCYFENITFENSFGYTKQTGPQALALYTTADRFAANNCYLRSYQDTYLTSYNNVADRHYLRNTKIEGAVDYIYGGGDVFFDACTLTCVRKDGGYIVAPSHKAGTAWGYVFSNCTIDESKVSGVTTYFGRAWQNSPKTVFINTTLKAKVYATGWYYKMGAIPAVFADYNTMDANGNAVDLSQRISTYEYDNNGTPVTGTAKSSLTDAEAATYTYENVIFRSGDSWDPRMMSEAPDKPSNLLINGSAISWNSVPYSRLYIVFRNNSVLGFTTDNQFTDGTAVSGQTYSYAVQSVGEFGALSAISDVAQVLPLTGLELTAKKINGSAALSWTTRTESNVSHFEIERSSNDAVFAKVGKVNAVGTSKSLTRYSFSDVLPLTGDSYYRIKAVDFDGKYIYSGTVVLKGSELSFYVYPAIATTTLQVVHPEAGRKGIVQIYGLNGGLVKTVSVENGTETLINVQSLVPGMYLIKFRNGADTETAKFIKQ